jgi:hypothetical protein
MSAAMTASLPHVPRRITEETTTALVAQCIQWRRSQEAFTRHADRISPTHRGSPAVDSATIESHACWIRMVGMVEVHVEQLLESLFASAPLPIDPTRVTRFNRARSQPPRNWTDLKTRYSEFHSIDLATISDWSRFEACLVVRNTFAHGLGRFTTHQLAKDLAKEAVVVGLPVRDGCAVIDQQGMRTCFNTCRNVVLELDLRV